MSNVLYHDVSGVSSLVSSIMEKINNYQQIISQLENLVNTINSSNDWVDREVKTAFINQCNSYITYYNAFVHSLTNYVNGYLGNKSKEVANIERAFS